jgi:hypothetical protein
MRSERKELRLTPEMVAAVDRAKGDVSFNRFVERALEKALGQDPGSGDNAHAVGVVSSSPVSSRAPAEGSPRSKPFVCPVASCQWAGSEKQNEEQCPIHRRNLIARRS